ncbi:carboxypeptidase regulatory-like domain-containing protein [Natronorubrum bangense]|nr:carboxypeptidase regulatory-like domain-containing protein [Natronorubrum bangense]
MANWGSIGKSTLTILIAVMMVCAVFAPIGAAGTTGHAANTSDSESVSETVSTNAEPAPIDDELRTAEGTVEVVLQLEDVDNRILAQSHDTAGTLQAHAAAAQDPIERYTESTDGVELEQTFWITNAVLVSVDTEHVPIEQLARLEGVTEVHENYEVHLLEPPGNSDLTASAATGLSASAGEKRAVSSSSTDNGTVDTSSVETTYGVDQINAPAVWERYGTKGAGSTIAVLDTGVDPDHPDIEIDDENWKNFVDDQEGPHDNEGHGTHVSGTVVGGAESGEYIGVAPNATLYHGKVLDDAGAGSFTSIASGMQWAVDEDVDVISMSLGASGYESGFIDEIRNAEAAGTVVISASGNEGEGNSSSPANVYDGLAVGANDEFEQVASFSSGEEIDTESAWGTKKDWPETYIVPDVTAPGVAVNSAASGGGYEKLHGTSMATPHVSGTVGLILSIEADLTSNEISSALTETAWKPDGQPEYQDTRYGHGIIDAKAAMDNLTTGGSVEGTVTEGHHDDPVENATVELFDSDGESVDTAQTNETGAYEITDLVPDEYDLEARATGFEPSTPSTISVSGGPEAQPVTENVSLVGNATLEGTVDDAETDEPVPDTTVTVTGPYGPYETTTAANGTYTVDNVPGTGDEYTIDASADDYLPATTSTHIESNTTATANLSLEPKTLFVEIDETESPVVAGDVATINATVRNTDETNVTENVSLEIDGDTEDTREVALEANSSANISMAWETENVSAGDYEALLTFGGDDARTTVTVLPDVDLEHTLVEPTRTDDAFAEVLGVRLTKSSDPIELGADSGTDIQISNPETNESVTLTPDEGSKTLTDEPLRLSIYDGTGAVVSEPTVESISTESAPLNVSVSGNETMFETETFSSYSVSFVDRQSELPLSQTEDRLIGVGYDAQLEQNGTTDEISLSFTRDDAVEESWSVTFDLLELDDNDSSPEPVLTKDVPNDAGSDSFEFSIDTADLEAGEYGWKLEIDDSEHDSPRIIGFVGGDDDPITVDEQDDEHAVLNGTVTEHTHGDPIENATVDLYADNESIETRVTNESGEYEFTGLDAHTEYDLEVQAAGFEAESRAGITVNETPTTENVTLAGDAAVEGTVSDAETDEPLSEATLSVSGPYGPYEATTADNGTYTVDTVPGTGDEYTIDADADEYQSATNATHLESNTTATANFSLEPASQSGGGGLPSLSPPEEPEPAQFMLESVDAPTDVDAGSQFSVDAVVENVGGQSDTANVTVSIDGTVSAEASQFILDGNTEQLTFDVVAPDTAGDHELVVETADDQYVTTLTVVDDEADDVSQGEEPPQHTGENETDEDDDVLYEVGDGQPGFGIPVAIVALLVGLLIARRAD